MGEMDFGGGKAPPAEQRPIPAEGSHDAICYAVVNWGDVLDEYEGEVKGVTHGVRFFFELDETMPEVWEAPDGRKVSIDKEYVGKPFVLSTYAIAMKYGKQAKFVKVMKDWLGAKDCPSSLVGYQLGSMKGRMAVVSVEWRPRDDGTFMARIKGIDKARPACPPMTVVNTTLPDWVIEARAKDNEKAARYLAAMAARASQSIAVEPFTGSDPGEGVPDGVPF